MDPRKMFHYAPDDRGGPANIVDDTLPDESEMTPIESDDEYDLVEDDPSRGPANLAGKSQAEIMAEVARLEAANRDLGAKVDPTTQLAQQFASFLDMQKPKAAPIAEGYRLKQAAMPTDPQALERFNKRLAEKYLDDPAGATREVMNAEMAPVLMRLAENIAMQSRELVRLDPDTSDIYKKYAAEIENDVAEASAQDKLSNPRIYHSAVERARARHFNELVTETTTAQREAIATEYLKSLGLDLDVLKKQGARAAPASAASSTLATPGGTRPGVPPGGKKTINVTPQQKAMLTERALALGVSVGELAASMRERGQL